MWVFIRNEPGDLLFALKSETEKIFSLSDDTFLYVEFLLRAKHALFPDPFIKLFNRLLFTLFITSIHNSAFTLYFTEDLWYN